VVVLFIRLVEIEYLRKSETVANPGRIDEDIHELHGHWCCKGLAGFSEDHTFHGGYSRDRWWCQTIGRRLEGTPRWARRRDCTRAWRALWVTSQLRKWCKDVLDFFQRRLSFFLACAACENLDGVSMMNRLILLLTFFDGARLFFDVFFHPLKLFQLCKPVRL